MKHSLLNKVQAALSVFHCALADDLTVCFGGNRFAILEVALKDFKPFLLVMGRQFCYENTSYRTRKDFKKPTGLLDFRLSITFRSHNKNVQSMQTLLPHFDAQIVGCTITNDRRAAAGFITSPVCRFCETTKESLLHIIHDCPARPSTFRGLLDHELGPNFTGLGIVEHPVAVAQARTRVSKHLDVHVVALDTAMPHIMWWTDGSVLAQQHFWITSAAFAIYNEQETCVASGPVHHFALSSYSAELYAILVAACLAPAGVTVYTDCQTVVNMFHTLTIARKVSTEWSHTQWWTRILQLWETKFLSNTNFFQVAWMPAHLCDHLPFDAITDARANQIGWPRMFLRCNRLADKKAKEIANATSVIDIDLLPHVRVAALERQTALVALNQLIGLDGVVKPVFTTREDREQIACDDVRSRFPDWAWECDPVAFTWQPLATSQDREVLQPCLSAADVESFLGFLTDLRWRVTESDSVAYVELAHIFVLRKFTLEAVQGESSIGNLTRVLKKWCALLFQQSEQTLLPGVHLRDGIHLCGRAIPKGVIAHARPWFSTQELEAFASKLLAGGGRSLKTWDFPLESFGF